MKDKLFKLALFTAVPARWRRPLVWSAAILLIVVATVVYQPAAAKTGALLIWTDSKLAVMDIDTLSLTPVGPAPADALMAPSPGCFGLVKTPCWVTANAVLYTIELAPVRPAAVSRVLPVGDGYAWIDDPAVSWSPDGQWLAYPVWNTAQAQAELRLYNAATGEGRTIAAGIAPHVAPAWSPACAEGLNATNCRLAYKLRQPADLQDPFFPGLAAFRFADETEEVWQIPAQPVYELRWSAGNRLMYSRPARHFRYADDNRPVFDLPSAARLGNLSPDGRFVVFYQPFRLKDSCPDASNPDECLYLGVWLGRPGLAEKPELIYNLSLNRPQEGLNFVPVWAPHGNAFVFFQEGKLVYYNLLQHQAMIWYKEETGKLRSLPVFSPNEEAVAFVDSLGRGASDYRLVVVNPRLKPVEQIIKTDTGFRVLAWLPF